MTLVYVCAGVAAAALLLYLWQAYSKLSRAGVRHLPIVPFFGNFAYILLGQEHVTDFLLRLARTFPDDKIVGQYELMNPVLVIQDIELLKRVAIKDFEHFVDRRGFVDTSDPMFGRSLLMLKGDEWKAMRSTLSPAFTSSKIRLMVPFMVEVGEKMIKVLKQRIKESGNVYTDIEARELCARYACDVIASCAFGLKVDSQSENNQFFTMTSEVTKFNLKSLLKVFVYRVCPKIAKVFKIKISSSEASNFFTQLVLDTMKSRDMNKITRSDMIHLLLEVKKGQLQHEGKDTEDTDAGFATVEESSVGKRHHDIEWSDTDLVAQAALFLLAGFDTVSTAMSFLLHELALSPDVQDRLVREIREHDDRHHGKFDFDSIQQMTYLDIVVSEGLRLWPGAPFADRICVKDYEVGKLNSKATKNFIIRKGDCIHISIWILHRSPQLFPDPEKFDPERFSEEKRGSIKPFSYLPFGLGPRNCIGSRFALCELKVLLYQLLRDGGLPLGEDLLPYQIERRRFPNEDQRRRLATSQNQAVK